MSSEDEVLDPSKRNNFDFNLGGFKDEFLGSSSEEEDNSLQRKEPPLAPPVNPQPVLYQNVPTSIPFDVAELEKMSIKPVLPKKQIVV